MTLPPPPDWMREQFDTSHPEQPYGPGAICDDCGHFATRHDEDGCHWPDRPCPCAGMLWLDQRWPRPWLPAPEGLRAS